MHEHAHELMHISLVIELVKALSSHVGAMREFSAGNAEDFLARVVVAGVCARMCIFVSVCVCMCVSSYMDSNVRGTYISDDTHMYKYKLICTFP
jgi:hypothetical protein